MKKKVERVAIKQSLKYQLDESLPPGSHLKWKMRRFPSRLLSGLLRTKTELKKQL